MNYHLLYLSFGIIAVLPLSCASPFEYRREEGSGVRVIQSPSSNPILIGQSTIAKTRRVPPFVGGNLREVRGNKVVILSSGLEGALAPQGYSPAEFPVPELVGEYVQTTLMQLNCEVLGREVLEGKGIVPNQAILAEQRLSVSGLSNDQVERIGLLETGDLVAEVRVHNARYFNQSIEGLRSPIRIAEFKFGIRFIEVVSGSTVFSANYSVKATDYIEDNIHLSSAEIKRGGRNAQAKLIELDFLIQKSLEDVFSNSSHR